MPSTDRTVKSFERAGRLLESAFFLESDAVLLERQRALRLMAETREALSAASGITDERVLTRLVELDVRPEVVAALATVPLVEVAWADGAIQPEERETILHHANAQGIGPQSVEYALLERWLAHRPDPGLLEAWEAYVCNLCERLDQADRERLRAELLHATRATAQAAGGILGLARVSGAEKRMLERLESGFACPKCASPG